MSEIELYLAADRRASYLREQILDAEAELRVLAAQKKALLDAMRQQPQANPVKDSLDEIQASLDELRGTYDPDPE